MCCIINCDVCNHGNRVLSTNYAAMELIQHVMIPVDNTLNMDELVPSARRPANLAALGANLAALGANSARVISLSIHDVISCGQTQTDRQTNAQRLHD
jgi:hypothetical protein